MTKPTGRPRGRPPLEEPMVHVSIRLPVYLYQHFNATGRLSGAIRDALDAQVRRQRLLDIVKDDD